MRKSIKELRLARGLSQNELASRTNISTDRLSRMENKILVVTPEEQERLCLVLHCVPEDLDLAPLRIRGGQTKDAGLQRFRGSPEYAPRPELTSADCVEALRRDLAGFMKRFNGKLDSWWPFLSIAPGEARDEAVLQLLELHRDARPTQTSTDYVGFHRWPVVNRDGTGAGHLIRPALYTEHWLLMFQIGVQTPKYYRMDGLLVVLQPHKGFLDLEVDDPFHNPKLDAARAADIDLPTLRIPSRDLINGPSLTERLRAMGFCLPPNL